MSTLTGVGKGQGPHIRLIAPDADEAAVARLLSMLRAQPWPNWSLAAPIVDQSESENEAKRLPPQATLGDALLSDLRPSDLFAVVAQGGDRGH